MSNPKPGEKVIKGLTGSEGIAIGPVLVVDDKRKKIQPKRIKADAIYIHLQRFAKAKTAFLKELDELTSNLDKKTAEILETQKHIISDREIEQKINAVIEVELYDVEYAIYGTFNEFIERLRESGSELFQQRIVDLENLRDRLILLACDNDKELEIEDGTILVLQDISPTDLVSYHDKGIKGLVMDKGGITSHAAIIAQSLNIPCIVSTKVGVKHASNSKKAVLDASSGELILNPSRAVLSEFKKKIREINKAQKAFIKAGDRSETKDGFPFHLRANIEFEQELILANEFKAEGIGLLRTEALLFGGMSHRSELEQDKYYESILSGISGPVTIRLFDVGGDKLHSQTPDENNPFLGWRGVRMLLDEKAMLGGQLRSILKCAGKYPGRIRILVPMVALIEEIVEVRKAMEEVQKSLMDTGVTIDESIPLGIMVEVPSVALLADKFAKEVDFFSIGTNDLTQYALAVDRGNERICSVYQQHHPSVWQLIKTTVKAANENAVPVSVCGELAGDKLGALCLLGMGVNDLSMSPGSIPKVKEALTSRSMLELKDLSDRVLDCSTTEQVRALMNSTD